MLNEEDINTWTLTRDYSKILTTKMYYTKDNSDIHNMPAIHAKALLDCLTCEHSSKLLEDIMEYRVRTCLDSVDIDFSAPRVKLAYDQVFTSYKQHYLSDKSESTYEYEDQINARLGLNYGNLIELHLTTMIKR